MHLMCSVGGMFRKKQTNKLINIQNIIVNIYIISSISKQLDYIHKSGLRWSVEFIVVFLT